MISIACGCGKRLSTEDAHAGKQVVCPNCGESITFVMERSTSINESSVANQHVLSLPAIDPVNVCSNCGSSSVITGVLMVNDFRVHGPLFSPDCSGFFSWLFRWKKGVALADYQFRSCLACGHLWARLTPEVLRDYIEKHGNDETRQLLRPFSKAESKPELA